VTAGLGLSLALLALPSVQAAQEAQGAQGAGGVSLFADPGDLAARPAAKFSTRTEPDYPAQANLRRAEANVYTLIAVENCVTQPARIVGIDGTDPDMNEQFADAVKAAVKTWRADCAATANSTFVIPQSFRFSLPLSNRTAYTWKAGENNAMATLSQMVPGSVKITEPLAGSATNCKKPVRVMFRQPHAENAVASGLSPDVAAWVKRWELEPKFRFDLINIPVELRFPCGRITP
jgi:hypothetical protein